MFSNNQRLLQRTPTEGISRKEYIKMLVQEYRTTTDVEAQEQVTANLANFAYDPLNWQFLLDAKALDLFLHVLATPNERLQLHGLSGFCNMTYNLEAFEFVTLPANFAEISGLFLRTTNRDIVIICITLFYQLLMELPTSHIRQLVTSPAILRRSRDLYTETVDDPRANSLLSIFLDDYGTWSADDELPEEHLQSTSEPPRATKEPQ